MCWIPAHKGLFGNDLADDIAKQGAKSSDDECRVEVPIPGATIKLRIRNYVFKLWTNEWQQTQVAKHTKAFYLSPNPSKAKYVYKLARLELGRFIRLISGHNNLNYFQTRIGLANSEQCRFCDTEEETFLHLLYDCPRFWMTRREMFADRLPGAEICSGQ